ncbi:MAG: TetR/AcrR family transcriptional regulator [Lachnospiraceae bacterium]|nr:TetR/AcrR family transcriptional regulator [Lachnospiraceae bacterium]
MSKEYSSKEIAIYKAVVELFEEGADLNNLTVAEITGKAGIGKGTAYAYFSDKEEMIAKALFYNSKSFCEQLYKGMLKEKDLYAKVNYVLLKMERQIPKADCIFRFTNMMSDNSTISKRIRDIVREEVLSAKMSAVNIVKKVLEDEFMDRETTSEDKMEYLVLSIYSKLLCYAMVLKEDKYKQEEKLSAMRALIIDGICREVRAI